MSDTFIQRSICEAIDIIADKKIAEAGFDKTKKVVISKLSNKALGEYQVKDGDSYYTAYATSSEIFFQDGQEVYVLIPGNDLQRRKTILGGVNVIATNYQDIPPASESYNTVGSNFVNFNSQLGLNSYYPGGDVLILYTGQGGLDEVGILATENGDPLITEEKDDPDYIVGWDNIIKLDIDAINKYIKQSDGIALGFTVRTELDSLQQGGGSYGMVVEAIVNDDNGDAAVQRYNVSNLDVIGQPFMLTSPTRVEHFEKNVDTSKFVRISRIYLYAYDFPGQSSEIKTNDIFFKDITINGGLALTQEQLDGYFVHIDYSKDGNELGGQKNLTQVTLQAQLKVKGRLITKNVQYYWFRKNNTILRGSPKYCDKGGDGWQCLNYKENQTVKEFVPYTKRTFIFTSTKEDNSSLGKAMAPERNTQILCVARYNGTNFSEKGKVINYNEKEVSIYSQDRKGQDNKTDYYFGNGHPILECKFEKQEGVLYRYNWKVTPARGREYSKGNTSDDQYINAYNTLYGTQKQQTLPDGITKSTSSEIGYITKKNKIEKSKQESYIKSLKNNYTQAVEEWKKQEFAERIKDQYYIYFPINSITNYSMVSCTVEKQVEDDWIYVGTGSITLYNKLEIEGMYTLNLNNGTQVFQYDDKGNSPLSSQIEKPLQIRPLTFTLLDNEGNEVPYSAIVNNGSVTWLFPKNNTLLTTTEKDDLQNQQGIILTGADKAFAADFYIYRNSKQKNIERESFTYSIAERYDLKKTNNYIKLIVKYRQLTFEAYTNFTFPKDGDPGTNGTDWVAKIVPVNCSSTDRYYISNQQNTKIFNDNGQTFDKFQYQIYNNSIKSTNNPVNYWTIPPVLHYESTNVNKTDKSKYTSKIKCTFDPTNVSQVSLELNKSFSPKFEIDQETKKDDFANIVHILRGQRNTSNNTGSLKYLAEIPICTNYIKNGQYRLKIKPKTGFNYVVYSSDGSSPDYDNTLPFEIVVEKYFSQSQLQYFAQADEEYSYFWRVIGNLNIGNTITSKKVNVSPKNTFDGQDLTSAVICQVKRKDGDNKFTQIGILHVPIYIIINRYGNRALNGWDGSSLKLDENGNGQILTPQIGAGYKDQNNTFTGMLMGQLNLNTNDPTIGYNQDIGLMGYDRGQRTIFLDAKTGKAEFGKYTAGKIIIDPRQDKALLYSGNYYTYNKDGSIKGLNNQGMLIDLTTPQIQFGNGNFSVNSEGHLTARGGGSIANWNITDKTLYSQNGDITVGMNSDPNNKDYNPNDNKNDTSLHTSHGNMAFWAGSGSGDEVKNFYVTHNGYLFSKSGKIATWNISSTALTDNYVGMGQKTFTSTSLNPAFGTNYGENTSVSARFWGINKVVNDKKEDITTDSDVQFIVDSKGRLFAKEGKIGPWWLKKEELTNGEVGLGNRTITADKLKSSFYNKDDTVENGIVARFWGGSSASNYNFAVSDNGTLYSKAGLIGGWHITKDQLWAVYSAPDKDHPSGTRIRANGTISGGYGTSTKVVNEETGEVTFTGGKWQINPNGSATFSNITATKGKIGNWIINGGAISSSDNSVQLTSDGTLVAKKGYIGQVQIDSSGIHGNGFDITGTSAYFTGLAIDLTANNMTANGSGGGAMRANAADSGASFIASGFSAYGNKGGSIGGNTYDTSKLNLLSAYINDKLLAMQTEIYFVDGVTVQGSNLDMTSIGDIVKVTSTPTSISVSGNDSTGTNITLSGSVDIPTITLASKSVCTRFPSITFSRQQASLVGASGSFKTATNATLSFATGNSK